MNQKSKTTFINYDGETAQWTRQSTNETQKSINELVDSYPSLSRSPTPNNEVLILPRIFISSNQVSNSSSIFIPNNQVSDLSNTSTSNNQASIICQLTIKNSQNGENISCLISYNLTTSTTNLVTHLRTKHQIYPSINSVISNNSKQKTIEQMFESTNPLPRFKQEKILFRLIAWIVDDMQSFYAITNKKFQELIYECEPRFEFLCNNTIQSKIGQSVSYTRTQLNILMDETMIKFAFTTDLWIAHHTPYIGITIHWISANFISYQALLTIKNLPYSHTGITDNASNMKRAIRQLGCDHIGCTAHTFQLAINDGLELINDELVKKAKNLNNFLVNHDKYRDRFRKVQEDIINRTNLQTSQRKPLNPISSDTIHEHQLQLSHDFDRQVRADANVLKNLLLSDNEWKCLNELVILLKPFATATTLLGGSQYPTLSQMFSTFHKLFNHLDTMNSILIYLDIRIVLEKIRESLTRRWENSNILGYIASFLDPRFKNLAFISEERIQQIIEKLKKNATESIPTIFESSDNSAQISYLQDQSLMSLFYNDFNIMTIITETPIESELRIYRNMPVLSKYEVSHPLYATNNLYKWWNDHKATLPLLAEQARIYLAIPASSVPAEHLFSDAGNILTDKRNQLDPTNIHDILFLKENSAFMNVFPGLLQKKS
ncbi:7748_t:CDS:2 [Ambispora gerdemannii]|uniref:7748_t:CDS:1 n=1 Tax=Ambispora gerdemannii TaxID=144530 RepID=A0A9N9B5W9_9GLOM|nr:7748_t:CDS:2 [Ambispora gerdemannii]